MWSYWLELAQLPNLASDGVVVILVVCIATPIQVLLLALMARRAGANPADYLGLTLPRKGGCDNGRPGQSVPAGSN
jgi:hypothetical protein